jgi:hypothetical protein
VAFRDIVKLDQVSQFRDRLYRGTDEAFGAAVRKWLLLERPQGFLSQGLEAVEFVAEIHKADKAKKKKAHMRLIWISKIGEINVCCHSSFPKNKFRRVQGTRRGSDLCNIGMYIAE